MSRGAACARTAVDAKLARSLRWFWNTHIEEQGPHALQYGLLSTRFCF